MIQLGIMNDGSEVAVRTVPLTVYDVMKKHIESTMNIRGDFCISYKVMHLHSPRLLCVRSLGSPWYDYVYFNSASSGIQCVVLLLL